MVYKVIIKKNAYYDSVTLMSLSAKVMELEGVEEAVVSMATPMNKALLENVGMLTEEAKASSENDLMIAVKMDKDEEIEETVKFIEEQLNAKKTVKKKGVGTVKTITAAKAEMPEANIAVISVPGEYAAREARQALKQGLHVMLFSDNVSIKDEKELKEIGREKGLFVMGPDCGTAIINQVGLCFANKVNKGSIGLIAASGTGLQEVAVQINRLGFGISQAIGTGGRDLHESIGGMMMLEGLKALEKDEQTEVIVLISKPPAPSIQDFILSQVKKSTKPVIVCFIDGNREEAEKAGVLFASTLMDAAEIAVRLVNPSVVLPQENIQEKEYWKKAAKSQMSESQKYVRGLFCGGTLTSEALSILRNYTKDIKSNVAKKQEEKLECIETSTGHTLLDLGDDIFTVGKPHPMIEPSLRNNRILQEAADPETAVLLLDFELGFGSHNDPIGITLDTIKKAQEHAKKADRYLPIVAYICGTDQDKQGFAQHVKRLTDEGVFVANSNKEATLLAASFIPHTSK